MSGHSVYTWTVEGDDVLIQEAEDGVVTSSWSWSIGQKEIARAFWDTLKSETESRGDLKATFVERSST